MDRIILSEGIGVGSIPTMNTIEQSILTFVRFKHIVSTSKEVDFLHLRKERIDLDDSIKNKRITF